jgi:hypothetical protein
MPINVDDGIFAALREAGSSDSQIEDAKLVLSPLCQMQGHICILNATGAALESEMSIKWLQENKPHLLPRENQIADAELAFVGRGNKTAAARLIRELGQAEADRVAQMYGKAHALDNEPGVAPKREQQKRGDSTTEHKGNPFSRAGWNVSKQGQLIRSLGIEKASAMARAVGVTIGATKPVM